jgi:hypothetical protein
MTHTINCLNCKDIGWVCEGHTDKPWSDIEYCCGAPGIPCEICNDCDYDNPPRMPNEFVKILDKEDGWRN